MSRSVPNQRWSPVPDAITEMASARLQQSPYPAVRQICCWFDCGTLILGGRAPSFFHKQVAQEAVADLEGIDEVLNCIEVHDG